METARLVFHLPKLSDLDESVALWSDPGVTRHIGGKPFTREETWHRLCRYVGHWQLLGYGYWVVRDKAGAYVGEVGFGDWQRAMEPKLDAPEAGWVLLPSMHGKGYATEAVRAALQWLERTRGSGRSQCIIDPGNDASVRVAQKCGFVRQPDGTYKGNRTLVFERP